MAPTLYRLVWRKNITMDRAGLHWILMMEGIQQFVALWQQLWAFRLFDREYAIAWKISSTGNYSSKTAYKIQFAGTFPDFEWDVVWKTKVENKCKFFNWLILQNKLWTSDRILKCGGQPNICPLCPTLPESAAHMAVTCTYSRAIWVELAAWLGVNLLPLPHNSYWQFKSWWRSMMTDGNPDRQATTPPVNDRHNLAHLEGTL
jgi:hypothetical protein